MQLTEAPGNTLNLWPETLFSLRPKRWAPSGFGLLWAAKPRLFHHPLMSYMKHKQMLHSFAVRVPKSVPKHGRSPTHCVYSTQISQHSVQILTGAAWTLHYCKVHLAIMHSCARIEIILYFSLTCWQSSSRLFGNFYKNVMLELNRKNPKTFQIG